MGQSCAEHRLQRFGGHDDATGGTVDFPFIGLLQVQHENEAIVASSEVHLQVPGIVVNSALQILEERKGIVGTYEAISDDKLAGLIQAIPEPQREAAKAKVSEVRVKSTQAALADMACFSAFMLVCYLVLIVYFKTKGAYKPIELPRDEDAEAP